MRNRNAVIARGAERDYKICRSLVQVQYRPPGAKGSELQTVEI